MNATNNTERKLDNNKMTAVITDKGYQNVKLYSCANYGGKTWSNWLLEVLKILDKLAIMNVQN